MISHVLYDVERDTWVENWAADARQFRGAGASCSVSKRVLHGGRREGVELVEVANGELNFAVCPTRGMGLWRASFRGESIGWQSPIKDGPVHPAFVHLADRSGLGWLQGFDEFMARCGLECNGPPFEADGQKRPLHGRISNLPAHFVAVHIDEKSPHTITVEGRVDEVELFFTQARLTTRISTVPGSRALTVRDEVVNIGARPCPIELLYHWNFGAPLMGPGSRFVAPIKTVSPRDRRAAEGIGHFDTYGPPTPGFAEQVYFFELHGGKDARTVALLRDNASERGVALRFNTRELPCFTLWKNEGAGAEYVTGLEPAINYPNAYPFEKSQGRVRVLEPGASLTAETTLEVLPGAAELQRVQAEIAALQRLGAAVVHDRPIEPFAASG